ncbi:phytanoyl-CoA dioxygenase family protein [Pseudomonas sp. dw_358]|uniref:phytanoyl-CoA dioxygenase family protein n=1 Tax=Pseudomonas sp. dw_358 TaxID=2720083 RepID=UPI001BD24B34|nr:phytanoyl-CoA dioxygenase family protein [Pseudomonas sp. dw_358]
MNHVLTPQQVEAFNREGFVGQIRVLDADKLAVLNQRIADFESQRPADVAWAFDIKANLLFDWVYELGCLPTIVGAVQDLIGNDVYMTNAVFRIKKPGSSIDYGWHQDSARIEMTPSFVIVYISLSDSTAENGGLRVIPGTHDRVYPFTLHATAGQQKRKVARTTGVDETLAVDCLLKAGEMVIFHSNVVHGSAPNYSDGRRVAILYDFAPGAAIQSAGMSSGQLVAGQASENFGLEPVPETGLTDANVLMRRHYLTTYPENPLMGPLDPGERPTFPDRPY